MNFLIKNYLTTKLVVIFFLLISISVQAQIQGWNNPTAENKPWTRWWWHGNSVNKEGITAELESLYDKGFGGVELTPIFGVIGDEKNFIEFLSKDWMDMFIHTLKEADRLGMLVDLATGTGWPFGGPWVSDKDACKYLAHTIYEVNKGEIFNQKIEYIQQPIFRRIGNPVIDIYEASAKTGKRISQLKPEDIMTTQVAIEDIDQPIESNDNMQKMAFDQVRLPVPLNLITIMAYGDNGKIINLDKEISDEGNLKFKATDSHYKIIALFEGHHGKMVERAAPGGEGNVIDHFSKVAIRNYLRKFDFAFEGRDISSLRAFFNDSYEVDDARGQSNWTPWFFDSFFKSRGYDLRDYLPALLDEKFEDITLKNRIISDYRTVYAELIEETFTDEWREWAHNYGADIRNQSHGSPANILDLYAASDIPEAEGTQELRIKFASSAGHIAGKPLIASEAATWLNEHFLSDLSDLKQNVDRYLVHGVNHIVYHGTAYSPDNDIWPGRLFYAAIHANDRNPMWAHWQNLNQYISRSQSILQSGQPDNDILMYYPAFDVYGTEGPELLKHFDGHGKELEDSAFGKLAQDLVKKGYALDFISDKQMLKVEYGNELSVNGMNYKTIIVPETKFMPLATLEHLRKLGKQGASIFFQKNLPKSIPGLILNQEKLVQFEKIKEQLESEGKVKIIAEIQQGLEQDQFRRESMTDIGLNFIRRKIDGEIYYFITNWTTSVFEGELPLNINSSAAILMDPMTGKTGIAKSTNENGQLLVKIKLGKGQGMIIRCTENSDGLQDWPYYMETDQKIDFSPWETDFISGGAIYPQPFESENAELWTDQVGFDYQSFSGIGEYYSQFSINKNSAPYWLLDLGEVYETAEIFINDKSVGILIGPEYQLIIDGSILKKKNKIRIEVANKMANRIIDLDRKKIYWKKFYNTNFPPRLAENRGELGIFDASSWESLPSGIQGPITMKGLEIIQD